MAKSKKCVLFVLKYDSGYSEAHNRAQTRFDGAPWENNF